MCGRRGWQKVAWCHLCDAPGPLRAEAATPRSQHLRGLLSSAEYSGLVRVADISHGLDDDGQDHHMHQEVRARALPRKQL
jgi:hypothetical protein